MDEGTAAVMNDQTASAVRFTDDQRIRAIKAVRVLIAGLSKIEFHAVAANGGRRHSGASLPLFQD